MVTSSSACTLLGARDQEKDVLPAMDPFGVSVARPTAPHRASNEIPNPVAPPQALGHFRVSSGDWRPSLAMSPEAAAKGRQDTDMNLGGLCLARSQRRGTRGSERGLSPCRVCALLGRAAGANGAPQLRASAFCDFSGW